MMTETAGYCVYNMNTNLYWSQYPAGWVDNLGHATISDKRHALQTIKDRGGVLVAMDRNGNIRRV